MSRSAETSSLLPAGLQDVLPPEAAHEAAVVERLMAVFAGHGYERVKPPLVEFEESLLSGPGAAMAKLSFRLMDPVSQRMMALRADMTLQVARIAATRLGRQPRPLRLSYAGQVLRVKGSELRPERQFGQAGVELIGAASAEADVEVILLAAEALAALGVSQPLHRSQSFHPGAGGDRRRSASTRASSAALVEALDRRDAGAVTRLAGARRQLLRRPAARRRGRRAARSRPCSVSSCRRRARRSASAWPRSSICCWRAAPDLVLTIDPVEHRGLEYHSGVGFTFCCARRCGASSAGAGAMSAARGSPRPVSPFISTRCCALCRCPKPAAGCSCPPATSRTCRGRLARRRAGSPSPGWSPIAEIRGEARRLGCTHYLKAGRALAVEE